TSACLPDLVFFTHPSTSSIYTLSLHDALPICPSTCLTCNFPGALCAIWVNSHRVPVSVSVKKATPSINNTSAARIKTAIARKTRSGEHTSELQSRFDLVCRLLLEKKKNNHPTN